MKKLIIALIAVSLFSCVGQKKMARNAHKIEKTTKVFSKKDSSKVVDRSLQIRDKILLSLKTNNKKIDSVIRLRLKGFKTEKQSGNNSYSAHFDYEKLALSIAAIIGATQNEVVNNTTTEQKESDTKDMKEEYFYRIIKRIPWWFWLLIIVVFLPQIVSRFRLIFDPLSAMVSKSKNTN